MLRLRGTHSTAAPGVPGTMPVMPAVAAVLFDWDGTLSDSRAALLSAWYESSEAVLGQRYPANAGEEDIVFTRPGAEIWTAIARDDQQAARLGNAFQEAYGRHSGLLRAFDGVAHVLVGLRASGVATAVVTSKGRRRFEPDAERISLADKIDVAVCAGEAAPKPDPGGLLEALRQLRVAPHRAAMVGDTVVDIAAARAAQVTPIGVAWGHGDSASLLAAGASFVARTPAELLSLLMMPGEGSG